MVQFDKREFLDGLRGIAAFQVVLFHSEIPFFSNGYSGVDIFFILSGYLITSLLIREMDHNKRINFTRFYARRSRRLIAASCVVLLTTGIIYKIIISPWTLLMNRSTFTASCFFVENWNLYHSSKNYFSQGDDKSPVVHYWSLGVEEQYYLLWPTLFYFLCKLTKCKYTSILKILFGMSVAIILVNSIITPRDVMLVYLSTPSRAYQLFAGSILAIVVFQFDGDRDFAAKLSSLGSLLSYSGFILINLLSTMYFSHFSSTAVGIFCCLATFLLILGLEISKEDCLIKKLLTSEILINLGKISYSLYLWHFPVFIFGKALKIFPIENDLHNLCQAFIVVSASVSLAMLSWVLFENRINRIDISTKNAQKIAISLGILAILVTYGALQLILTVPEETMRIHDQIYKGNADDVIPLQ